MICDAIVIDYDPFNMDSRAYIMRDGGSTENYVVASSIPELTERIITMANEHKIYEVKVRGPFAITSEIKRSIEKSEMRQYEQKRITVEGM